MRDIYLAAAVALALVLGSAFDVHAQAPQTLPGGLQRDPGAKVALVYTLPGVNWSKYKTIQLRPLAVPNKVRNAAPSGRSSGFEGSFVLNAQDVATLQAAYDKSMRDALTAGGYTFVDTPQSDTLVIVAEVLNITLVAPLDTSGENVGSVTITRDAGSIAVSAALADGTTGQVLAEAGDRKYGANVWGINNSVTSLAQARLAFDDWAKLLTNRLNERRGAAD